MVYVILALGLFFATAAAIFLFGVGLVATTLVQCWRERDWTLFALNVWLLVVLVTLGVLFIETVALSQ